MISITLKKYAVIAFAVVLVSTMSVPQARAQSIADLQQQLNQLLAQVAALQAQLAGVTGSCSVTFARSLGIGSSGQDVRALQQFLNRDASTRLAVSGAGSPGFETQYYGPITANAVSRFQVQYRADVLTPLGLLQPTGYFGPSSLAKANALCSAVVPPPADDDDDDDQTGELEGGEARLQNFGVDEGDDTSVAEGQENAPVMDVEFEVEDGDIQVNRIDVAFDHLSGGDDDPWDVFENVSIWVDGEEVADMDVDRRSVWSDNEPNSGDYRIRLASIDDFIVREGNTAEFTVAVTLAGHVDDAGSVEWELFIPDDGIRTHDSLNLQHYIGDTDEIVQFEINEGGADAELAIRTSTDNPEASVLQVDRSTRSDWHEVLAFELDADDSTDDIEIRELPLTVEVTNTETYNAIVDDVRLVIGGEEYDDVSVTDGGTDTGVLTFEFDQNEVVIDSGNSVDASLELRFKALPEADEGTEVRAYITSAQADAIEAEGREDLSASQISGSASGETHELRTGGTTSGNVVTTETLRTNSSATVDDDEGVFTIRFDATAFDQDLYIPRSAERGTAQGTAGVNYVVEDSAGDTVAAGSSNAALSSNASVSGSYYRVPEGQTRTFTLTVSYDPATQGFYRVQMYSINYNSTGANPNTHQRSVPESTYETDPLLI